MDINIYDYEKGYINKDGKINTFFNGCTLSFNINESFKGDTGYLFVSKTADANGSWAYYALYKQDGTLVKVGPTIVKTSLQKSTMIQIDFSEDLDYSDLILKVSVSKQGGSCLLNITDNTLLYPNSKSLEFEDIIKKENLSNTLGYSTDFPLNQKSASLFNSLSQILKPQNYCLNTYKYIEGWINTSGTISPITSGITVQFSDLSKISNINGTYLYIMGVADGASFVAYALYKKDGTLLKLGPSIQPGVNSFYRNVFTQVEFDSDWDLTDIVLKCSFSKKTGGACLAVSSSSPNINYFTPDIEEINLEDFKDNHWKGRKWVAYGTSITNTNGEGIYAKYLEKISGMSRTNRGFSGGGITTSSNQTIYNAIMNADSDGKLDADLITIECYANDGSAPLGTVYDLTDNSTFAGALNKCIRYLQSKTSAQIVVLQSPPGRYYYADPSIVYNGTETYGSDNHTRHDATEIIRKVCEFNNVYFINWSGLGLERIKGNNLYVRDQIHHTELGGYIFAQGIWSYLKNIPCFETSIPSDF